MNALTTRKIRKHKLESAKKSLQMLTCYDFQTAQLLNETDVDLILVGDSVGNVILGHETTVEVTIEEMLIFAKAVRRGATSKFIVADLPFGSYYDLASGLKNATKLFKKSKVQSLKLEGAYPYQLELIERLTQTGIPIMGHIGLTPQSVHEQGGYYTHGKNQNSKEKLINEAIALEKAGVFAIVLECVEPEVATKITQSIGIPTIGIGAGNLTDGQVLVINDLLKMGPHTPPKFCSPMANLYDYKKEILNNYLQKNKHGFEIENNLHN